MYNLPELIPAIEFNRKKNYNLSFLYFNRDIL